MTGVQTCALPICVSFLFEEPEICRKLLERAKQVFVDVFENVEMIVEHGTK